METERHRVLLIEDDKVDQMAFRRVVKGNNIPYDYTIAGSVAEAKAILASEKFDIVIADYLLGDGTAFDIFGLKIDAPIIVITGSGDEEVVVKAMHAGASDYLIKDPENNYLKVLLATVENAIGRKRAEDALRESEERYSTFFKASQDSVFITSKEGRWQDMNDAAVELLGYETKDELLKVNVPDLYENPEKRKRHLQLIEQQGFTKEFPVNLRRKDGSIINTLVTSVAKKDVNGNVIGYQGTIRDITERKRMEKALRESEKELQTILDSVPVNIFHIDGNSRFVRVNEVLAKRYGMTPEDFKGKTSKELFLEIGEEYVKSDKEVLESGEPQIGVTRKIKTPEGVRWVRLDKVPVKDADGNVTGVIGFELDITKSIEAQDELRNAHKELQDIVEFLPDATFVIDRDKKVIAWNRAIEEMTGVRKEDIIGKGDYAYAVPFYGERRPILTDLVFSSDEEIESRYAHVGKKGNTLFAEIYSPFMYGGKGAYLGGIATPLYDPEGT